MPTLSDRQLAFCRAYADGASGAEAARRAGYSPRSARFQARDLLAKPHIREAIECLRQEHVPVDDTSLEGHLIALAVIRDGGVAGRGACGCYASGGGSRAGAGLPAYRAVLGKVGLVGL